MSSFMSIVWSRRAFSSQISPLRLDLTETESLLSGFHLFWLPLKRNIGILFFAGIPGGAAPSPLEFSRHCADRHRPCCGTTGGFTRRHGQRRYTTSLSLDGCSPAEPSSVSRCAVKATLLRLFASLLCSLASFSFRSRSAWISGARPAIMSRGVTWPMALCSRTLL